MKVNGIEGMTPEQVQREVEQGARFVIYLYCISILVMTFKRGTDIYFVRPGENAVVKGLPYTLLSLVVGWWGFPWGLVYTPHALYVNLRGGKDVTAEVMSSLAGPRVEYDASVPQNPW
jgi:hypothetical protein